MRKNAIRLMLVIAFLVTGSVVPLYAASTPMPMPPLPPMHSN